MSALGWLLNLDFAGGSSAGLPGTPSYRTLIVLVEMRTCSITPDDRTYVIPAEQRTK